MWTGTYITVWSMHTTAARVLFSGAVEKGHLTQIEVCFGRRVGTYSFLKEAMCDLSPK
jgi:hypothetical protein